MQPNGNPKTLVCFRLNRQCPIFSSLSDTNKVKNKTALDMRDFDLGGRDELENSFDKEIKSRQLLESKSCQDCRQNKNT